MRGLAACCKLPIPSKSKLSAEMHIKLMGDLNHRADIQAASTTLKSVIPRARQDQRMTWSLELQAETCLNGDGNDEDSIVNDHSK